MQALPSPLSRRRDGCAPYGFITQLAELYSKNRNGKTLLKLPSQSHVLPAQVIDNLETSQLAVVTNTGYLLVIDANELPILPRGKGNKIIQIPSEKVEKREEYVINTAILPTKNSALVITSGKRQVTLKTSDLAHYRGKRGQRGHKLPRGLQKPDHLTVNSN